jgi:hypothetical protein
VGNERSDMAERRRSVPSLWGTSLNDFNEVAAMGHVLPAPKM